MELTEEEQRRWDEAYAANSRCPRCGHEVEPQFVEWLGSLGVARTPVFKPGPCEQEDCSWR